MGQPRNLGYDIYKVLPATEEPDAFPSDPFDADNGSYEPVGSDASSTPGLTSLVNTGGAVLNEEGVVLTPDISSVDLSHDIVFSASGLTTVAWAAGTITFANGLSYEIEAGDTGVMGGRTIIYLDTNVSTTVLQTTTSPSAAVGVKKVIIAVAQNEASGQASFQVGTGIGGLGIGAAQLFVDSLAAIVADLGAITAGTITLNTSGHIKGGQTDYDTGIGFFLGLHGGTHKWSIGNSAGNKMLWNGSELFISGNFSPSSLVNMPTYTVANLPVVAAADGPHAPSGVV